MSIDGNLSGMSAVLSGVPQGSVLGPLLFVLFINDIIEVIDYETKILLYADDLKKYRQINSEQDRIKLQVDISSLQGWASQNKMKFHLDKCKVLNCQLSNKAVSNFKCFLYDTEL